MDTKKDARVPNRSSHTPWRRIDGRAVIVQPIAGRVHELNPVGTRLWENADGKRTLAEIAAEISGEFATPAEEAFGDAAEFYSELEKLGLIEFR
ncbi:MAG: PqqD family protein [Oligoflexia bacterium]|nr:PqqD family protein [Oligoflexia bacterium]